MIPETIASFGLLGFPVQVERTTKVDPEIGSAAARCHALRLSVAARHAGDVHLLLPGLNARAGNFRFSSGFRTPQFPRLYLTLWEFPLPGIELLNIMLLELFAEAESSSHPQFVDKEWYEVEEEIHRDWEMSHPGTWNRVGNAIHFGWDTTRRHH